MKPDLTSQPPSDLVELKIFELPNSATSGPQAALPLALNVRQIMSRSRYNVRLMLTPFFVAVALVVLAMLQSFTGIGPASNIFALWALVAIVVGFVVGIISLFQEKTVGVWWRLLIGVLYLPTTVFFILLAGF